MSEGDMWQDEDGVYNIVVSSKHYLFWPCKCGHVFGRHWGMLSMWPEAEHCYECDCEKFDPEQPFEEWRNSK